MAPRNLERRLLPHSSERKLIQALLIKGPVSTGEGKCMKRKLPEDKVDEIFENLNYALEGKDYLAGDVVYALGLMLAHAIRSSRDKRLTVEEATRLTLDQVKLIINLELKIDSVAETSMMEAFLRREN
jgi:hypothetical protein